MSEPEFDPEHVDTCPACAHHVKEQEVEANIRCQICWQVIPAWSSSRTPGYCTACESTLDQPKFPPPTRGLEHYERGQQ